MRETLQYQTQKIDGLEKENHLLREHIRFLTLKQFAPSKDDMPGEGYQLSLFDEEDIEPETKPVIEEKISYNRKKGGRKGLDPNLPRTEVIIDISDSDKLCGCGCQKTRIGEESNEQLEVIPSSAKVIKTIRPKYACPKCEGLEDEGPTVRIAPVPPALIPRSILTPSLMATVLVGKMVDSVPFYRQEKQFQRMGVHIGRGSMASWAIQMAEKAQYVVDLLVKEAKKRPSLQMDETTVQVMNETGRKNTQKSYMWLLRAGPPKIGPPENRIPFPEEPEMVVYWYQPTRSSSHAKTLLTGYKGYVQTDEYCGYSFLDNPDAFALGWTHVLCMAHLRRNFVDAAKVTRTKKHPQGTGLAVDIVSDIKEIYKKDKEIRMLVDTREDLVQQLQAHVLPLLKELHEKVKNSSGKMPPKSKLGKAVGYAARTLPKIMNYVDCPNLTLDNNDIENKVRPFAVGRKNWLMANTPDGAKALATWYTLIETAKSNGWNPHEYLLHLFQGFLVDAKPESLLPILPPPAPSA